MALFGLFYRDKSGVETPLEIENAMTENATATPAASATPEAVEMKTAQINLAETPEGRAMQEKLDAQARLIERLSADSEKARKDAVSRQAADFSASLVKDVRIPAAEAPKAADLFARLAEADRAANAEAGKGLLDGFKQFCDLIPNASGRFVAGADGKAVAAVESVASDEAKPLSDARRKELLAHTPGGQAALRREGVRP